jgi:hypothetical protein
VRLDVDSAFRRQQVKRAIEVRSERRAFIVDAAHGGQTEDLITTAVGQNRMVPSDELVEPTAPCD